MCQGCLPGQLHLARAVVPSLASLELVASSPNPATPNTYFYGGPIITMKNGSFSPVDALAIDSSTGNISAVGTLDEVKAVAGPDATKFNLNGRCLLPGFVEPHLHVGLSALLGNLFVDVTPLSVKTKEEALAKLKAEADKLQSGQWLAGFGYDPSRIKPIGKDLSASDLDDGVSKTVNIVVLNASGHLAYVNNCAFTTCGITVNTPNPTGGIYEQKDGKLTGVVVEQPAIHTFTQNLPRPSQTDFIQWANSTLNTWAKAGCTTIFDAGIGLVNANNKDDITLLAYLSRLPTCPVRITGAISAQLASSPVLCLENQPPPYICGNLSLQAIKVWADGSTQGFTGAVRAPYLNNGGWGFLNWSDSDIRTTMETWQKTGWQLVVHSNGDRSTDQVLGAYDWVLKQNPNPNPKILHRIDHFTVTHPGQLKAAKKLNLGASHLTAHVYYWGEAFRDWILGPERAKRIDPFREDDETGLIYSYHSDSPVTPVNPLLYVKTAVTRELYNTNPVQVLGEEQRVDLETALRGITINAAKHCMLEEVCGTLEVGKSADLVLLEKDIREVKPSKLDELAVLGTWLAGRRAYDPNEPDAEVKPRAPLVRARL